MRADVFPLRALFSLALAIGWLSILASGDDGPQRWVTTWTTANAASDQPAEFSNQTIREVVHTTIGGGALRIRLSNMVFDLASVAKPFVPSSPANFPAPET